LSAIPDLQNLKIRNETTPNNAIFITFVFKALSNEGGFIYGFVACSCSFKFYTNPVR
jgi:hypothetical protein